MKTLGCTMMALAALAGGLRAQQPAAAPADGAWATSINVGVNLARGNSETLLATAGVAAERKEGQNELRLGAGGNYGETEVERADGTTDSERNVQNAKAYTEYRRIVGERAYGYLNGDIIHDDIADINYRLTVGPGAGYYLLKTPATGLSADLGAAYISEDLVDEGSNDTIAVRVGQRFDHAFSKTAKVWEAVEYLPAVDDFDDYLLNAEVGAEAAMTTTVSLRVVAQNKYDSTPADAKDSNDLLLTAGISIKL